MERKDQTVNSLGTPEIPRIALEKIIANPFQILPYRGYGSGVMRAIAAYPSIELIDDQEGNLFKAIFWRKAALLHS
jgi:hypothetical protein